MRLWPGCVRRDSRRMLRIDTGHIVIDIVSYKAQAMRYDRIIKMPPLLFQKFTDVIQEIDGLL